MEQITFFASSDRLNKLSKIGDLLEKINKRVDSDNIWANAKRNIL